MKLFSAFLASPNARPTSRLATLRRSLASVAIPLAAFGAISIPGQALAQDNYATVTTLYGFSSPPTFDKLVEDGAGNFYGTQAPNGGLNQVYRFSPAGIFTSLYLFQGASGTGPQSLIMGADGNLYGVATSGGVVNGGIGAGTVYRLSLAGEFTLLHTFNGADGAGPNNLTQGTDGNFYGTTAQGGANNVGTVFRITPTGDFSTLYSFLGGVGSSANPVGVVQGRDGNLYGTTNSGGVFNASGYFTDAGTVFRLTLAGDFTLLYSFDTGNRGAQPSPLIQGTDGNFYGEYVDGFSSNGLAAYKITSDGDFTFLAGLGSSKLSETSVPLTQGSDGNFYSSTADYGSYVRGTIVRMTPDGQVTTLYTSNIPGGIGDRLSPVVQGNDGNFYGTSRYDLYRLTLLPPSALVPVITTTSLPSSEQGIGYAYQITATPSTEVFSATGLPSGLTISADGLISGTPTESGTFQVVVTAMNQAGSGTATFSLFLAGLSPVITSAPTATVQVGQPFSYQITSDTPNATFGASNLPLGLRVTSSGLISGMVANTGTYNVTLEVANALSNYGTAPLTLTVTAAPVPPAVHPPFFAGEVALSNGVYYLVFPNGNFFGYYAYLSDPNYVFHFDLGYEYVFDAVDGKNGVYLYDFKSGGFFYTSPNFPFPYLYDFSLNAVLYYYPDPNNAGHYNTDGIRYFYNFATGLIIAK